MRPFVVLALNVAIGSVGLAIGGFAGGCLIAAVVVADCMAVVAEGRAWTREDAADALWDDSPAPEQTASPGERRDHPSPAGRVRSATPRMPSAEVPGDVFDWGREGRAG